MICQRQCHTDTQMSTIITHLQHRQQVGSDTGTSGTPATAVPLSPTSIPPAQPSPATPIGGHPTPVIQMEHDGNEMKVDQASPTEVAEDPYG
eukprot:2101187-Pyramimonas_sp.AAC.1